MSSTTSDSRRVAMLAEDTAKLLTALQAELVAIKAETTAKMASLEDTIANLAHENALLKRRLSATAWRSRCSPRRPAWTCSRSSIA